LGLLGVKVFKFLFRQDLQDFAGFFVKHFKSVEVQKPGFWKIGKSELDDFHFMGTDLQDYH